VSLTPSHVVGFFMRYSFIPIAQVACASLLVDPPLAIDPCSVLCSSTACVGGSVCNLGICSNLHKATDGSVRSGDADGVSFDPVTCGEALAEFTTWEPFSAYAKGLKNLGVSCFANALMQVLLHTTSMRMFLENIREWMQKIGGMEGLKTLIGEGSCCATYPNSTTHDLTINHN